MRLSEFDYPLPPELIAQRPLERRDGSRLMHVSRAAIDHRQFDELPALLRRGDLVVVNDARVIPARLLGKKAGSGGKAELLLVRPAAGSPADALEGAAAGVEWFCIGQASKAFKVGNRVEFDGGVSAEVLEALGGGEYRVRLEADGSLDEALARAGRLPLPPYIERAPEASDSERYQTVYSAAPGSVAAPTAGLHFTPELFRRLAANGVEVAWLTLDVGPGTFLPVREDDPSKHVMHAERAVLPEAAAAAVRAAKRVGRRVVAVGTTVVRTLETFASASEVVGHGEQQTRLFITPGHRFQVVDAMVTNFHLPRSTLLMLVAAFAGRERILEAYAEAVAQRYRFFSYGDAMLLEGGA